jgi:hypothetical protein
MQIMVERSFSSVKDFLKIGKTKQKASFGF